MSRTDLRLLAWLSPAFPTGGYACSHGLEWAVETGDVVDGDTLFVWLEDVLRHGAGRSDTILLRHAHRAAHDTPALAELIAFALATSPSRERRAEAVGQGRAFIAAIRAWGMDDIPGDIPYCVAVGAAAGRAGIDVDSTAAGALQAFAANLISAAVRLVPLGQTVGLGALARLEPLIAGVAEEASSATLEDIGGFCFRSDIASMRHETQYTRLFRS